MGDPVLNPDLTLICEEKTIKAHSALLAARFENLIYSLIFLSRSPFFKVALTSTEDRRVRILKVSGCAMKTLKTAVHYMYGEDIPDNSSFLELVHLLEISEKFLTEDLREAASKLLASKLTKEDPKKINRLDEIIGMLFSTIKDNTLLEATILYDVYNLVAAKVTLDERDSLNTRILQEVATIKVTIDELPVLFNLVQEYHWCFSKELCKPIASFLKATANEVLILQKLCGMEENHHLIDSNVLVKVYDLVQNFIFKVKYNQESESAADPLKLKILETISKSEVNPANLPGLLIDMQGFRGHNFNTALSSVVKKYCEEIPAKNLIITSALELDLNFLVPTLSNMFPSENIPGLLTAYKKFLAIKVLTGDTACPQQLSPSPLVDQVWHLHLQHPGLYVAACRKIGEGIDLIDHNPSNAEDDPYGYKKLERLERTKIAYKLLFGTEAPTEFWSWSALKPGAGGGQIFVRDLTGKALTFEVRFDEKIAELKMKIQYRQGIPAGSQRLIFLGRQLDNSLSLLDYNIYKDSTLHLILRLCGC